jgi:hypothetical protein
MKRNFKIDWLHTITWLAILTITVTLWTYIFSLFL